MSSFIWGVFIFNTFKDVPNIISGTGSAAYSKAVAESKMKGSDD